MLILIPSRGTEDVPSQTLRVLKPGGRRGGGGAVRSGQSPEGDSEDREIREDKR